MRIALTCLVYDRDEQHDQLTRMLDSAEKAGTTDYVLSIDAKSTPSTETYIRERLGDRAIILSHCLEDDDDFARYRNATVAAVPAECEWFFWIDLDDVLQLKRTMPEVIAAGVAREPDMICIRSDYQYDRDEYGNLTTVADRKRIMRNNRVWTWTSRLHEDIHADPEGPYGKTTDILWIHDAKSEWRDKSPDRNLRILRKMLADEPDNPRAHFYLANQLFAAKRYLECVEHFDRYCMLSGWDGEKWYARVYQAIAYRMLNLWDKAIEADTSAARLCPHWPDGFLGLAESYARMGQWEQARSWGEMGLKLIAENSLPDPLVIVNPLAYTFNWTTWMSTVYYNLGLEDKALAALEAGVKVRPEPDLIRKRDHLKAALAKRRATDGAVKLADYLATHSEVENAISIMEAVPAGMRRSAPVLKVREELHRRVEHTTSAVALRDALWAREPEFSDRTPWVGWAERRLARMGAERILVLGDPSAAVHLSEHFQVVYLALDQGSGKAVNWKAVEKGVMGTKEIEGQEEGEKIAVPDMTGPLTAAIAGADTIVARARRQGKFDAVVIADLLDCVGNPADILKQAERINPRVLFWVPNGDYEGPITPGPLRVRRYDYHDAGRLVRRRGLTVECHNVADGAREGRLVVEYVAEEKQAGAPVVFWCMPTTDEWSPDSIEAGGIGGSETALIRVAEEFALRGSPVKVWAQAEGIWNGVRYGPTQSFVPQECWLFVAWRRPGPINSTQVKELAANRLMWVHDVVFGLLPNDWFKGPALVGLSDWHVGNLKNAYHGPKVIKSGNGIDPERFDQEVERQKHKLIFASSPDRGLHLVLAAFPKIRAKYPDATLDVYYGFDLAQRYAPEYIAKVQLAASKLEGVTLHGRIDQDALARAYLASDVMLYPSTLPDGKRFHETYCISAVEAQAAGCVPITTNWGALAETNATGIQVESPDELFDALCRFWDSPEEEQDQVRATGKAWAREQTWEKVVDGWIDAVEQDEKDRLVIETKIAEALA